MHEHEELFEYEVEEMKEPLIEGVGIRYGQDDHIAYYCLFPDSEEQKQWLPLVLELEDEGMVQFNQDGQLSPVLDGSWEQREAQLAAESDQLIIYYNFDGDAYVRFWYNGEPETDSLIFHDASGRAYKFNRYNGLLRIPPLDD